MDSNSFSPNRSRRCLPKLADALAYSDSESERAASAVPSPEQDLVVDHLPGRSVSLEFSLGQPSSVSVEILPDQSAIEMSPGRAGSLDLPLGRADSLDLSLGRAASLDLSFGLEASSYLSSRPRTTATSFHLSPGRDTTPEMSPRRAAPYQLSPGRQTTPEMTPGRLSSLHMSPGRDKSMDMPPGRPTLRVSPGEASSFDLSSGQAASPGISLRRSKLGRNASHQPAEQASSFDLSPERATSFEVSQRKTESETLTRRTVSNNILSEDGPQHKRSLSRTPSDVGKIHIPTTQRLDHGISDIGSPEPASPFSFGAMPLPPIKASRHEKECREDMKKTEEERQKVGKEIELNEIKDILAIQKETLDKSRVTGIDLRFLSKIRNEERTLIKASRRENKSYAESKTPQEERRTVGKEKELQDIKTILANQMEIFDKRRVTGNDLRILSQHRNVESIPLAKTDTTVVDKKIMPKHVPVPPKAPKPPSQPKSHIIVRETKASRLRKIVQNEQPVVTRKVLPPVKSPVNPQARPIRVYNAPGRSFFSPLPSSRSSSESPPPTPKKDGPPRPEFVPSLDLSFLLSPEDYPNGDPIPPPVFAVRETKASKLRRQKKEEEEKKAKSQGKKDKSRDVEWEHSLESIQRTRTPTQTFKPSPPKPYKKPVPVIVKETKASKLRIKLPEIKKGNRK